MVTLNNSITEVKGIGPKFAVKLKKLGIETVKDLLWHFPFRYEDFAEVKKIADLKVNEPATISGVIQQVRVQRTWKRKMFIVEIVVVDDTGSISAVWFNQRHLAAILKKGKTINLAGKVVSKKNRIYLSSPVYEFVNYEEQDTKHTARLVPIYPETRGLTSKALRYLIKPVLDDLEKLDDFLPETVLGKFNFPEINSALNQIHFPDKPEESKFAKRRFAFEDLFLLQLINLRQRLKLAKQKSFSFEATDEYIEKLFKNLPFELTESQKKSFFEVINDLKKSRPMNRLLQGDVGSGKTIVAALVAIIVSKPFGATQGKQSVFMAPTEVLARQHYETFKKFFPEFEKGLGLFISSEVKVFYGDGLEQTIPKADFLKKISSGELKIIIGTHALIQKGVKFKDLAFVVIDEQHRFGVSQRAQLVKGSKTVPHFLSMSATPIPRTLTLTIFGDLDLSIIDELPKDRKPVITKIVAPENRDKAYAFIRGQVKKGRQVFVICPRIEKDTTILPEGIGYQFDWRIELKAVEEEYEKLSKNVFPDLKVGMLHGKLKAKEKARIMKEFKNKEIDILVATSVVEVGVDVPNATIMMIEGAERFGLAQLYQFRGRVGRGEHQSFCFLFTESFSSTTRERLESLLEAKNGFELAEKDLAIRGPGEILGESQTGLPDLAMKAIQNPDLVKASREMAEETLKEDPKLENHLALKNRLDLFQKEVHLE
ncbi:MAG: ATP-dependent DNA helicase RecG [Candidatus Paceibacterota bacterium]|jgi:ATP-dependent DNA helicase RecG